MTLAGSHTCAGSGDLLGEPDDVAGVGLVVEEGATMPFGGTSAFFHNKAIPPPGIAWALTSMGGQGAITAGAVGEGDGEVVWS